MSTRGQFFTSQTVTHVAEMNPACETRTSPTRAQWAGKELFTNSFYLFSVLPSHCDFFSPFKKSGLLL